MVVAPAGAVEISGTPLGLPSSFFHIRHLDIENWIFEAADRVLGGTATQKREHSTGLSGCKQVWTVANLACFLNRYTILCGFSPAIPTTHCDGLDKVPRFARLQCPAALHCFIAVYSIYYIHCMKHFSRVFPCVLRAAHFYISSEKYSGEVDRVTFSSSL